MKRRAVASEPIGRQVRDRLGDKWTVPIIVALADGSLRFGELGRRTGTAPKVLTSILRSLECDGLIERRESREGGLQVLYALSTTGWAFQQLIDDIDVWAARHEPRIIAARREYQPPTSRITPADAGAPARGGGVTISHICIPVRNIDHAIRDFADALGVDSSDVREAATVLQAGRGPERIRICWFPFPNLLVELIQQMGNSGPFQDYLGKGLSIAHLGLDVAPQWHVSSELRDDLGLKLSERPDGSIHRADVDLNAELGVEIHLLSPLLRETAERWLSASAATTSLAAQPVSRIGIVVPDVKQADRGYSKLMRMVDPLTRRSRAFRYRRREDAIIATCSGSGIAIDLIQPLSGPLREYLREHGPGVHHVGFNVGRNLTTTVDDLEHKGAEPLFGNAEGGHVCLDLSRKLGFRIDLTSSSQPTS